MRPFLANLNRWFKDVKILIFTWFYDHIAFKMKFRGLLKKISWILRAFRSTRVCTNAWFIWRSSKHVSMHVLLWLIYFYAFAFPRQKASKREFERFRPHLFYDFPEKATVACSIGLISGTRNKKCCCRCQNVCGWNRIALYQT